MKDTRKDLIERENGPESRLGGFLSHVPLAPQRLLDLALKPRESLEAAALWANETLAYLAIPKARRERVKEVSQKALERTRSDIEHGLESAQKSSKINKMKKK